jgi:hypothetical protein
MHVIADSFDFLMTSLLGFVVFHSSMAGVFVMLLVADVMTHP